MLYYLWSFLKYYFSEHFKNRRESLMFIIFGKRPELVNRKCVVFHYDNTKSHIYKSYQKLLRLGRDVLPHLPYSPPTPPIGFLFFL